MQTQRSSGGNSPFVVRFGDHGGGKCRKAAGLGKISRHACGRPIESPLMRETVGALFDPRLNALNLWRLLFASAVVWQHSWPLTGREHDGPFAQLGTQIWVDGFFVISGFLIVRSWHRHPRLRDYARARFLRIFPGLWVCLLVVAFVIAPLAVALQHEASLRLSSQVAYVLNNAVLNIFYYGIDGTPKNVPRPGVWDGPLWTVIFELICYIAVAVAGVVGLLKYRATIPVVFGLSVVAAAVLGYPVQQLETVPQMLARFAVVFSAGALLYQYRDKIPTRWSWVAAAVGIVMAAGLFPNYRVLAAIPLAYAVIVSGALLKNERLVLRNDISYGVYIYGWPMQQLLAVMGLAWLPAAAFFGLALAATVPLAALSWFLVEKPMMRLKRRVRPCSTR